MAEKSVDTGTRISVLESQVENINTNLDKLENKVETNYATLHHRISELRDDLHKDIESKNQRVIDKLEEQGNAASEQHKIIAEKISSIENWRWFLVGASVVIGYFLAHVKLENLL
jgi:hypothetical protein